MADILEVDHQARFIYLDNAAQKAEILAIDQV